MENFKSHKLKVDTFELCENDFRFLCNENDSLLLENVAIKLHYTNKLAAERKKKADLGQEIDQMKKKLQRLNSMRSDKVTGVTLVSSSAVEIPGQHLEVKSPPAAELQMEKYKGEVLAPKMTELNHQLQIERDLRAEAEAEANEAVDIADELMQKLEEMHKISDQPSVTPQMLDAELKTKMKGLQHETLQLNRILQKEKVLRAQAEFDKSEAFKVAEAHCKDTEAMQRVLEVSKRSISNALQTLNTMEKKIEDTANKFMAEKKDKDGPKQEIAELLQKQNDLREQKEAEDLRDFEILEARCQKWAEKSLSCHQAANGGKEEVSAVTCCGSLNKGGIQSVLKVPRK